MEILVVLIAVWAISALLTLRALYFDFVQYASVSGPPIVLAIQGALLGPFAFVSFLISDPEKGTIQKTFSLYPKSPNPVRQSFIDSIGSPAKFDADLRSWDRFRKVCLIRKWDGVDREKSMIEYLNDFPEPPRHSWEA